MSFSTLGLSPKILKALEKRDYHDATPIQQALIPAIMQGRDILAGAKTGTGKTAGFALPILQLLSQDSSARGDYPRALVLVPTRELARQVHASFEAYGQYLPLKSVLLHGGANISAQVKRLNAGADIVIATSGRLLEHLAQRHIRLDAVRHLVLDEADTILDMGFVHEVTKIIASLPPKRQTILISATLSGSLKRLSLEILHRPQRIEVDGMGAVAEHVKLLVYPVEAEQKAELLSYLIGSKNYQQVLVFVRKRAEAEVVARELNLSGLRSLVIHGEKSSGARAKALHAFKEGKIRVLVATDIAARGIDIPNLEVVIGYDIPHVTGDFVHRVGRTGRAGREGLAITLVSPKEEIALKAVERLIGRAISKVELEGYAHKREKPQKGARGTTQPQRKTAGAFGKKREHHATKKRRKVTKRDAFKARDATQNRAKPKKSQGRRGRGR